MGFVPVYSTEDAVTVALGDPMGYDTVDSLQYVLGKTIEAVVAPASEVKAAVEKLYPEDFETKFGIDGEEIDLEEKNILDADAESDAGDGDAPVIRLVSMIIMEACKMGCSDIHLEPLERSFRVR